MTNELPTDLRESLSSAEYEAVENWWNSLTAAERNDYCESSTLPEIEFQPLPLGEQDLDRGVQGIYDYLVNHEMRYVRFFPEANTESSYKIVSHYLAALGSDLKHRPGDVG